jgi:hypothetical protein
MLGANASKARNRCRVSFSTDDVLATSGGKGLAADPSTGRESR